MTTTTDHASTIALMQQARWDEALAQLEQAIAVDEQDSRALRLQGTIYHLTNRPKQALAPLQQALALDANNTSTLLNLGSAYLRIGQAADAEQCFSTVVALDPGSPDGHFNLGLALQQAGRLDDAERAYARALQCDPDALDAALNLAAVHLFQGNAQVCATQAQRIVNRQPTSLQAHLLLIRALIALNRLADADRALAHTPAALTEQVEMRALEGKLHAANGRLAEAATAYQAAFGLGDTSSQTTLGLSRCLLESGDPSAARDVLRTVVEHHECVAEHHALLGLALYESTQSQTAQADAKTKTETLEAALLAYEQALKLQPNAVHCMTARANLLFELDRDDLAEQAIDAAIAAAPTIVSAHLIRLERLIANGNTEDALHVCEQYLSNSGAECNMLAARAFLLYASGHNDEAGKLMDYQSLLVTTRITAPTGYADLATFNAALVKHILGHPSLSRHNAASKATQHGRQSGNLLFGERGPFEALETILWQAAGHYQQQLVRDSSHPFRANPPPLGAVYAWAVALERCGFQTPHIHPTAWLSGVYYPKVPAIVTQDNGEQGWIEFGAPPPELVMQPAAPTHRVKPEEGLLILFPSYFYHRTVPYDSDETRISIAFDFSPATRSWAT